MEKDQKEALLVAKELTAKFIEARTVSPANFGEIFPAIYRVVCETIQTQSTENGGPDSE